MVRDGNVMATVIKSEQPRVVDAFLKMAVDYCFLSALIRFT